MLTIIGTPLGNLKDISPRATEALENADLIIMESLVDSKKLLNALKIEKKQLRKYNDESSIHACEKLIQEMQDTNAAYITSAGMPGICDPGALLVRKAREAGIEVQVVPGPSAITTAIAGSGIRTSTFNFVGFLPRKPGPLQKLFQKHAQSQSVLVCFESPFRIVKSITALLSFPEAYVCVAKELTKLFENYFTGTPDEVLQKLNASQKNTKGEFTVIVDFRK